MSSIVGPKPPSQQYWLDRQWIHDHIAALVTDYPNQWIAVHCGMVLSAGPDLGIVEDTAKAQCSADDIVYQFIDDGSPIF